jgi:hypothetical protein
MPILRMLTRRITENGICINLVPKGLYGDLSGDKNMREVSEIEAKLLHFYFMRKLMLIRLLLKKQTYPEMILKMFLLIMQTGY